MLMVGLHDPVSAHSQTFVSEGKAHGSVRFTCARGHEITVFTTPEAARAVADAFNAAIAVQKQEDAA